MMTIDLHMHSTISDGTDTPAALLAKVRLLGLSVFSLTDHDDVQGCIDIRSQLRDGDPTFLTGIEFSTEEWQRRYHILGYGFDPQHEALQALIRKAHDIRLCKEQSHLDYLEGKHHITFSEEDVRALFSLPNPGKPHIANLLIKYGYTTSIPEGFSLYLNNFRCPYRDIAPEEAIEVITKAGGLSVLAHGIYAAGRKYLSEEELEERIRHLKELGLMGVECYYSRYTQKEQSLTKRLCSKYELYATSGSDYHGSNKAVVIGETHLEDAAQDADVMRFLEAVKCK